MPLVVYLDETGDHSLKLEDPSFPVFALVMLISDVDVYTDQIVPAFYKLKFDTFGHEAVILHSRDIRKSQGEFGLLTDADRRRSFLERINDLMRSLDYTLIASVIRKQHHKARYGMNAENPYDLALMFCLERLLPLLEIVGQTEVQLVAEARGKNEDDELRSTFQRVVTLGTSYISAERFSNVRFNLVFKPKAMNIIGTQMADLAAYPIARHVIDPAQANRAFTIIEPKFYRGPGSVRGLKVFPT